MDFQVGEKVIYPNHGIGVVESIQTRPTPAGKISLYKLRILSNDSRVWVPQQNADGVGLRHVITAGDVRKIFNILGDGNVDQHPNWKGRFKENSDKMRTGSLHEVAVVLKGLTFLSARRACRSGRSGCWTGPSSSRERARRGGGKDVRGVEERVDRASTRRSGRTAAPRRRSRAEAVVGRRASDA